MPAKPAIVLRASASFLLGCGLASCAHVPVSRLVADGQLEDACRVLRRCEGDPSECPELTTTAERVAANGSLARAAAKRVGLSIRVGEVADEALTRRLGFPVAADHKARNFTLGVTVAARDPVYRVSVHDLGVSGIPDLLFQGEDDVDRYVAAVGGPHRPRSTHVPTSGPLLGTSDVGRLLTAAGHVMTLGVGLALEATAPPPLPPSDGSYTDAKGRRVTWQTWPTLPEVIAIGETRDSHEDLSIPPGGAVTVTKGFTLLPWELDAGPEIEGYRAAWSVPTNGGSSEVAVSRAGWVISMSGDWLTVHEGQSGSKLASGKVCYLADDGLSLVAPDRATAACQDELGEVKFPELTFTKKVALPFRAGLSAQGGLYLAVAQERSRKVLLHRIDTWALHEELELPFEVTGLAVSADGARLAVGTSDGATHIRPIGGGAEIVHRPSRGDKARALAFSPDGRRVFAHDAIFRAHEFEAESGKEIHEYIIGSWLRRARYVASDLVAATGSDGTMLYRSGSLMPSVFDDPLATSPYPHGSDGLGVAPDSSLVCSGGDSRRIVCYARGPVQRSTLFDAWMPKTRTVSVGIRFELPGPAKVCPLSGYFEVDVPAGGSAREQLGALGARGDIPLAGAEKVY